MSRFLTKTNDNECIEEIESMEVCKWRINDMCCKDDSEYLGDMSCSCTSRKERKCFEKEDGVLENFGKPFSIETYIQDKVFKLCYVDENKAWFTSDFEHQWRR